MGNKGNKSDQDDDNSDEEIERDKRYGVNSSKKRDKSPYIRRSRSSLQKGYYWQKNTEDYESREIYCHVCDIYCSGHISWQQHKSGKRHTYRSEIQRQDELNQDSSTKRKRLKRKTNQETYNNARKKRKLAEETNEKSDFVGLDYVLVIHKEGKSVFQCLLCDTYTICKNPKQLADHILGDKHQKAYAEQFDKGLIKIKRLKSKKRGKGALEDSILQKLLNPNIKDKLEKNSLRKYDGNLSSCDKKSTKTNHRSTYAVKKNAAKIFLRNTLKQIENHNQRVSTGRKSSTFVPERRSSSSTPEIVSLKDLTPASQTTSSHICPPSPKSLVSQNSIFLSDEEVVSTKSAKPSVFELEKILTTADVFNLVLLKMKNIQFSNEELNLLTEVAEKSTKISKQFKEKISNLTVQENIPFINDVMEENSTTNEITVENIPFINDIMEENSTAHERTHEITLEPLPVIENSASPSVQELYNILRFSDSLKKIDVIPEYSSDENEIEIIFP